MTGAAGARCEPPSTFAGFSGPVERRSSSTPRARKKKSDSVGYLVDALSAWPASGQQRRRQRFQARRILRCAELPRREREASTCCRLTWAAVRTRRTLGQSAWRACSSTISKSATFEPSAGPCRKLRPVRCIARRGRRRGASFTFRFRVGARTLPDRHQTRKSLIQ
jgi:hypothetical protein